MTGSGADWISTGWDPAKILLAGSADRLGTRAAGAQLGVKDVSTGGTATAASIGKTGVIGAAVAQGAFPKAILLPALNLVTLRLPARWKDRIDRGAPRETE